MALVVRVMAMVVLMVDVVQLVSCATAYTVGESVKWTTMENVEHKQVVATETFHVADIIRELKLSWL